MGLIKPFMCSLQVAEQWELLQLPGLVLPTGLLLLAKAAKLSSSSLSETRGHVARLKVLLQSLL